MKIYILREGKQDGPYTEEATQSLLKQGSVRIGDLAWRSGMPTWLPLHAVLYPGPQDSGDQRPPPPPGSPAASPVSAAAKIAPVVSPMDPATPKQKALLSYLGIHFASDLSKDQAATLVNDAMEDPKHSAKVALWNEDRLRLHPALSAAELQARKDDRARHFFEICQTEGAEYFTKVTKAHCQVLVSHLDVAHPRWDAHESEAAQSYFSPAIAEKFPQLVQKEWIGKLHYPSPAKIVPEVAHRAPTALAAKKPSSLIGALVRGVFFGALILGMLWFGLKIFRPSSSSEVGQPTAQKKGVSRKVGDAKPANVTSAEGSKDASVPSPATTVSSNGANPADGTAATSPGSMNAAASAPDATSAMAPTSLFDEKPAPAASTGLAPEAPSVKSSVLLTKPFDAQLTYGKIKLPPGTPLSLISRDGPTVKVMYLKNVLTVPSSSTDIDAPSPAPSPTAAP